MCSDRSRTIARRELIGHMWRCCACPRKRCHLCGRPLRLQPVHELLDQRVDAGATGVEPYCARCSDAARMIQAFESARSAASGRRPSAGTRAISRSSGTSSQTETPSLLIAARFCGSANVPPPVATTRCRGASWSSEHRRVRRRGSRPRRASRRSRPPSGARAARSARRCRRPASPSRLASARASVVLPRGHEADQIDLVRFHRDEPARSVSKKPG